jgi:hypothetical protein
LLTAEAIPARGEVDEDEERGEEEVKDDRPADETAPADRVLASATVGSVGGARMGATEMPVTARRCLVACGRPPCCLTSTDWLDGLRSCLLEVREKPCSRPTPRGLLAIFYSPDSEREPYINLEFTRCSRQSSMLNLTIWASAIAIS